MEDGEIEEVPEDLVGRQVVHEPQAGPRVENRGGVVALELLVHVLSRHVHRVAEAVLGRRPCGRASRRSRASSENSLSTVRSAAVSSSGRMQAVRQQPERLEPRTLVWRQLVDHALQIGDVGDERLASRVDVLALDGRHPALTVGVVQPARRSGTGPSAARAACRTRCRAAPWRRARARAGSASAPPCRRSACRRPASRAARCASCSSYIDGSVIVTVCGSGITIAGSCRNISSRLLM